MKRIFGNALILGVAVLSLKGCFNPVIVDPKPLGTYADPTAPESLINNLQVSYRLREIEDYAKILAPEFIFRFRDVDQNTIGKEFWTRDEDSVGTRALFTAPEVAGIRISLVYSGRDTTVNTPGTPLDSIMIRILTTDLQVDQTNDVSWVVTDQQDMFFRSGNPVSGEDSTQWFLYEWRDLPSLAGPHVSPLSKTGPEIQRIDRSWGAVLQEAKNKIPP